MNRDRPATMLTKRERVAADVFIAMQAAHSDQAHSPEVWAKAAVELADALFDELDTPAELRDEPHFDHEGTP